MIYAYVCWYTVVRLVVFGFGLSATSEETQPYKILCGPFVFEPRPISTKKALAVNRLTANARSELPFIGEISANSWQ